MDYYKDIDFDRITTALRCVSPKQVMMVLAQQAATILGCCEDELYMMLVNGENQISTSGGVAVMQLQVPGIKQGFAALATLQREIDFHADDRQPIQIAALIMTPEREGALHLRRLARVSRLLGDERTKSRLVDVRDEQALRALLKDPEGWMLMAA